MATTRRGGGGRGMRGACGGVRRRDGSGRGRGNYGTSRQPSGQRRRIARMLAKVR